MNKIINWNPSNGVMIVEPGVLLKDIFFIIQCPNIYFEDLTKNIKKYKIKYEIKDFFENISALLKNTDLIISRCGAGTINDIIYYKIPSILIPLPSAKDNHQYENATFLSKQDCGIIMNQDNFDSNKALNFIRLILKDNTKKNKIKEKMSTTFVKILRYYSLLRLILHTKQTKQNI